MTNKVAVKTAVYSLLNGNSTLTDLLAGTTAIYYKQAPDNSPEPLVIFDFQFAGEENLTPTRSRNILLNIRGITTLETGGPSLAGTIDAAIAALFVGGSLSVPGWGTFWQVREDDISPPVDTDPAIKQHFTEGALYRIRQEQII